MASAWNYGECGAYVGDKYKYGASMQRRMRVTCDLISPWGSIKWRWINALSVGISHPEEAVDDKLLPGTHTLSDIKSMDPGDLFNMGITFAGFLAFNSAPVACWKQKINHGMWINLYEHTSGQFWMEKRWIKVQFRIICFVIISGKARTGNLILLIFWNYNSYCYSLRKWKGHTLK